MWTMSTNNIQLNLILIRNIYGVPLNWTYFQLKWYFPFCAISIEILNIALLNAFVYCYYVFLVCHQNASLWMETMKTKRKKKRKRYIKRNLCSRRYFQEKYVFILFLFNQLQENKLNIRIARLCQKISAKIINKILIIWKLISLLFFFSFCFLCFYKHSIKIYKNKEVLKKIIITRKLIIQETCVSK